MRTRATWVTSCFLASAIVMAGFQSCPAQNASPVINSNQESALPAVGKAPPELSGESPQRVLAELPPQLADILKGPTPLNRESTVFLDLKKKRVLLRTEVACEDCLLEMFCCLEQTKEHESVVWLRGKAFTVHSGLLALGIEPGKPVVYTPEFKEPSGPAINIFVNWIDENGKLQRQDAREWMRHSVSRYYSQPLAAPPPGVELPLMELRFDPFNKEILWFGQMTSAQRDKLLTLWDNADYQKAIRQFYKESQPSPMTAEFVFAGSYKFRPEDFEGTGKLLPEVYAAEGGQLICVANFASSMIDVREESSASDGGQSYEAVADKVPPRGTPVIVELTPANNPPESDEEPPTQK